MVPPAVSLGPAGAPCPGPRGTSCLLVLPRSPGGPARPRVAAPRGGAGPRRRRSSRRCRGGLADRASVPSSMPPRIPLGDRRHRALVGGCPAPRPHPPVRTRRPRAARRWRSSTGRPGPRAGRPVGRSGRPAPPGPSRRGPRAPDRRRPPPGASARRTSGASAARSTACASVSGSIGNLYSPVSDEHPRRKSGGRVRGALARAAFSRDPAPAPSRPRMASRARSSTYGPVKGFRSSMVSPLMWL